MTRRLISPSILPSPIIRTGTPEILEIWRVINAWGDISAFAESRIRE